MFHEYDYSYCDRQNLSTEKIFLRNSIYISTYSWDTIRHCYIAYWRDLLPTYSVAFELRSKPLRAWKKHSVLHGILKAIEPENYIRSWLFLDSFNERTEIVLKIQKLGISCRWTFVRNGFVTIVFNWKHLRWGFLIWELIFIYCGLFVLILVVFVLFLLSLRFGQSSPLAFFRWFTVTSDKNAGSCNRIPSNYCLP